MASPLVGYNTNVRHHGKVFHIQTEDSGLSHGHIFTHLFADGGRIVATKKTTYSQYIGSDRFPTVVKKLMQAQHKAMFIALRDGLFDTDELKGAKEFAARTIMLDEDRAAAEAAESIDVTVTAPIDASKPIQVKSYESPPSAALDTAALDTAALDTAALKQAALKQAALKQAALKQAALEQAALEQAALEQAALRFESSAGGVSAVIDHGPTLPGSIPSPIPHSSVVIAPAVAVAPIVRSFAKPDASKMPSSGRYTATQPVKRSSTRPKESLFGQDLLSEKSLDEVIMSYLADDLDKE